MNQIGYRLNNSLLVTVAVAACLLLAVIPAAGQAPAYRAPRTADGKPSLNGIWQAINEANWDIQGHAAQPGLLPVLGAVGAVPPGIGVVEGDEIPYRPEALAKKKENFANRLKLELIRDITFPDGRKLFPGASVGQVPDK